MNQVLSVFITIPGVEAGAKAQSGTMSEMIELVVKASTIVQAVIFLLFFFIFACVFIIVYKYIQIRRAQHQTTQFLEVFWESKRLDEIYQTAEELKRYTLILSRK